MPPVVTRTTTVPKITCILSECDFPHCPCANPAAADYQHAMAHAERYKAALEMVMERYGFAGLDPDEADTIDAILAE